MSKFYNIKGASVSGGQATTELISPTEASISIRSILLTNNHDTAAATVTLFIQDDPIGASTSTYNLLHTVAIPADSSLLLDEPSTLKFPQKYGLYITVAGSDEVDVFIGT
tara:strand:+ start:320 stop:649 length:330 start_codon:yes stop_codon:yes gene_type:complete